MPERFRSGIFLPGTGEKYSPLPSVVLQYIGVQITVSSPDGIPAGRKGRYHI